MCTSYIESQKVVAMATSLRCRVSAISAFCRPTTQTSSITNCLVAIVHTKPVRANCVLKLVAMVTSLSTSGVDLHATHDSLGPSEPTTQTASRSVQPFFAQMTAECPYILYNKGTPLSPQNCRFRGGSGPPCNT